jgi:hypothetical protein
MVAIKWSRLKMSPGPAPATKAYLVRERRLLNLSPKISEESSCELWHWLFYCVFLKRRRRNTESFAYPSPKELRPRRLPQKQEKKNRLKLRLLAAKLSAPWTPTNIELITKFVMTKSSAIPKPGCAADAREIFAPLARLPSPLRRIPLLSLRPVQHLLNLQVFLIVIH